MSSYVYREILDCEIPDFTVGSQSNFEPKQECLHCQYTAVLYIPGNSPAAEFGSPAAEFGSPAAEFGSPAAGLKLAVVQTRPRPMMWLTSTEYWLALEGSRRRSTRTLQHHDCQIRPRTPKRNRVTPIQMTCLIGRAREETMRMGSYSTVLAVMTLPLIHAPIQK